LAIYALKRHFSNFEIEKQRKKTESSGLIPVGLLKTLYNKSHVKIKV